MFRNKNTNRVKRWVKFDAEMIWKKHNAKIAAAHPWMLQDLGGLWWLQRWVTEGPDLWREYSTFYRLINDPPHFVNEGYYTENPRAYFPTRKHAENFIKYLIDRSTPILCNQPHDYEHFYYNTAGEYVTDPWARI